MIKLNKIFSELNLKFLTISTFSGLLIASAPSLAYVLNGTKQPNISAIAWKEQLITREFYTPFVTAKNDWDATKSKVGFAMNTTSPEMIVLDYKSTDGYDAKTLVDNTKPEYIYLNYTYLFGNNSTELRSTNGHEIGHALGLDHPPKTGTTQILMYTLAYRNRNVLFTPQTDDVNGVNAIYGYP